MLVAAYLASPAAWRITWALIASSVWPRIAQNECTSASQSAVGRMNTSAG